MNNLFSWDTVFKDNTKIKQVKERWSIEDACSVKVPAAVKSQKRAQKIEAKLWPIIRALNGYGARAGAIALLSDGSGYAELRESDGTATVASVSPAKNGLVFKAGSINAAGAITEYESTRHGSVLLAAYLAFCYHKDGEVQNTMETLRNYAQYEDDADDWDDSITRDVFGKALCVLSSNLYYTYMDEPAQTTQNAELLIKKIRVSDLKNWLIDKPIEGTVTKISVKQAPSISVTKGQYALNENRIFTAEEEGLIPILPETYIYPAWLTSVCEDLKRSSIFPQPFRNVLLTGPSGTGKTKGAQAIAYALGLPYVKITCSPDMDMFDVLGQMLPNTEKADIQKIANNLSIPSFEDVEGDFSGSFQKLFGRTPGKYDSAGDCYKEIMNRLLDNIQASSDFAYVESPFIRAIENGWLVEVQEPTIIKRSSVLVGLNAILENDPDTASITLVTGKVINRHPDSVVVMTTNSDYEGCNKIQQSVLSRIDIVRQIDNPEIKVLVQRTKKLTGFKHDVKLKKMAECITKMNAYCREKDITDGVCGPRELQNWVKKTMILEMITGEPLNDELIVSAAFSTVLSKISQIAEEVEEILTAIFQKTFDQQTVIDAQNNYMMGVY